jgi:hypothetical protein
MRSIKTLFQMLLAPEQATASLRPSHPFLGALVLLFVAYWAIGMLKSPYITAALSSGLAEAGIPTAHARDLADRMWLLSLSSTVIIWLKVVFVAAVIWLATLLGTFVVAFRTVLSGLVYCQIVPFLKEIIELGMYRWRGLESVRSIADLEFRWGIDLVLHLPAAGLLAALGSIDVFYLWWLALVFLVVYRGAGASRGHALLVVGGLLIYKVALRAIT